MKNLGPRIRAGDLRFRKVDLRRLGEGLGSLHQSDKLVDQRARMHSMVPARSKIAEQRSSQTPEGGVKKMPPLPLWEGLNRQGFQRRTVSNDQRGPILPNQLFLPQMAQEPVGKSFRMRRNSIGAGKV